MHKDENSDLEEYYQESIQFVKSHYENFPVLSFFIKKELRKHIAVIYQFARQADDIADEGTNSPEKRIKLLDEYEDSFKDAVESNFASGFWRILKNTIETKNLTVSHFLNLLAAFKQDVHKNSYSDFDDLLNYCRNSANPVGRLILELHNIRDPLANQLSDKICTALQLTNFYQDVKVDLKKGRVYLPSTEMDIFNVSGDKRKVIFYNENFINFMKFQIDRTKKLFNEGRKLLSYLPPGLKLQIITTINGGELVLKKIEEIDYNVLKSRPKLGKIDFLRLFFVSSISEK